MLGLPAPEPFPAVLPVSSWDDPDAALVLATSQGAVKRTLLSAFARTTRAGLAAIRLGKVCVQGSQGYTGRGTGSHTDSGWCACAAATLQHAEGTSAPSPEPPRLLHAQNECLVAGGFAPPGAQLLLASSDGRLCRFNADIVRCAGRAAGSVKVCGACPKDYMPGMLLHAVCWFGVVGWLDAAASAAVICLPPVPPWNMYTYSPPPGLHTPPSL